MFSLADVGTGTAAEAFVATGLACTKHAAQMNHIVCAVITYVLYGYMVYTILPDFYLKYHCRVHPPYSPAILYYYTVLL